MEWSRWLIIFMIIMINFRLLLKCGDSGKFELFIHNMVEREMKSSLKYMEKMKENGVKIPIVEESLMHMIYTGFFHQYFRSLSMI